MWIEASRKCLEKLPGCESLVRRHWEVLERAAQWEVLQKLPTMPIKSMINGGCAVGASRFIDKSKVIHVLDEEIPSDIFSQDVGGIVTTRYYL